jgi:hypothetical protein
LQVPAESPGVTQQLLGIELEGDDHAGFIVEGCTGVDEGQTEGCFPCARRTFDQDVVVMPMLGSGNSSIHAACLGRQQSSL